MERKNSRPKALARPAKAGLEEKARFSEIVVRPICIAITSQ
jgi:hypothetical protein